MYLEKDAIVGCSGKRLGSERDDRKRERRVPEFSIAYLKFLSVLCL